MGRRRAAKNSCACFSGELSGPAFAPCERDADAPSVLAALSRSAACAARRAAATCALIPTFRAGDNESLSASDIRGGGRPGSRRKSTLSGEFAPAARGVPPIPSRAEGRGIRSGMLRSAASLTSSLTRASFIVGLAPKVGAERWGSSPSSSARPTSSSIRPRRLTSLSRISCTSARRACMRRSEFVCSARNCAISPIIGSALFGAVAADCNVFRVASSSSSNSATVRSRAAVDSAVEFSELSRP